ncbi:uncharacterized protein AC631_00052 [Debaryomyces fabryi]|uniref:DNA damage checkpoint protein LCD1 n=1 Tax=Debaryomyces fabryi TaxID=58627 RepID=A0A0V1Q7B7_9ASCO|nr:uncharacterized protein AC631_00052 [Debaryomyces fabryi]KSA04181.1 hypothetical protein AC631_00052 [Debaryomyces fabryi]CUM46238.1 unnamed protein product [Debaryomyces fabryi]
MSLSDDDFDDDDDEILLALTKVKSTQNRQVTTPNNIDKPTQNNNNTQLPSDDIQVRLNRSDGEIAILRAQLQQLQNQKQEDLNKLKESYNIDKLKNDEQLKALKFTVQKLEDEKKFLNNELRGATAIKRRKLPNRVDESMMDIDAMSILDPQQANGVTYKHEQAESVEPETELRPILPQKVIKIQNDASLFTDHIWNHCINGSKRSTLNYLSKIYVDTDILVHDFRTNAKMPLSTAITEYLMLKKNLRLDELVAEFTQTLSDLVEILVEKKLILSIPFLLALIHASLNFRSSAVSQASIKALLESICKLALNFTFLLDSSQDEEDFINYHDVPNQVMVLEKFALVCCLDIIEKLMSLSSLFGARFIDTIWKENYIKVELFRKCLPENTERFKNFAQINLIYNFVEILMSSISETTFAYDGAPNKVLNESIINSLLKVFLIDLPVKDDFMFYGLNRIIGNNIDFNKVDCIIPTSETLLNHSMICRPCPIPYEYLLEKMVPVKKENNLNSKDLQMNQLAFELQSKHEFHVLNLRLKVATLLESFIVTKSSTQIFELKEYIKSIVRTIGFEQVFIMRSPRSRTIYLRIQIIAVLVRILNYISSEVRGLNNLIYPETLYEIFVILLRIAFGSNSLSSEAHSLLLEIRNRYKYDKAVFNDNCERKAREINHITFSDLHTDGKVVADIESELANGLEFPYETDTIELAREILDLCVTHEEADNLYFNMNNEDFNFDEMALVDD